MAQSDTVVVVVPLIVDDKSVPEFGARMPPRMRSAGASALARSCATRQRCRSAPPATGPPSRRSPSDPVLIVGTDLFVCFSPERVYSGRIFADLRKYPKLVGGLDAPLTERAIEFYESALEFDVRDDLPRRQRRLGSGLYRGGRARQLAETTYRNINIGFANELARYADRLDIDVIKVIDGSNSQPFSHVHRPGVAVGGHCIPVYPRSPPRGRSRCDHPRCGLRGERSDARVHRRTSGRSAHLTRRHPGRRTRSRLPRRREGDCVLGSLRPRGRLRDRGAIPLVHDPLYSDTELDELGLTPYHLGEPTDAAIVQADHAQYRDLSPEQLPGITAIVDGRDVLDRRPFDDASVMVKFLGRPSPR